MTDISPTPAAADPLSPGAIDFRRVDAERDAERLHRWLTHPRSHFWQMQDASVRQVHDTYTAMAKNPHADAWVGEAGGEPIVLVETYDPAHDRLARHVELHDGDLGMHLLIAPPAGAPRAGLTSVVMEAVTAFCFRLGAGRVVVEPDVRNTAVLVKNAEVGFERLHDVELPEKRAAFSVCTPGAFRRVTSARATAWRRAERLVTAKALGEFAHELLITPRLLDGGQDEGPARFAVDAPGAEWRFLATRYALDHWQVEPSGIVRLTPDGHPHPPTSADLVLDLRDALGLDGDLLRTYLEELTSTVAHRARTTSPARPSSAGLLDAPAHEIEAAMAEGHPCFVATNGRIGFSQDDLDRFAPESGADARPLWVAVARDATHVAHSREYADADAAWRAALGERQLRVLSARMVTLGCDPQEYRVMPVHPWQWQERLMTTFAPDVAAGRIVLLGEDVDVHRPAQSIRTWTNVDDPARPYVKTALAVRNMGFVRGLSPAYMRGTPAINDHVAEAVRTDALLADAGFDVLTEFASIGYTGDVYHRHELGGPQSKMTAALWRHSPATRAAPGERHLTMAALLHRDPRGRAFVTELVRAAGCGPEQWLREYLHAYVRPVVHLLCAHRLAFIPHGENIILRLRGHRVVGVFLKDIGEEVGLMDDGLDPARIEALDPLVRRIVVPASSDDIALGLFTDVFDGFLRFLAPILVADGLLSEHAFWAAVDDTLTAYEADRPQAAASLPLRAPTFARSCLNRLQLRNPVEMVALDDAVGSLIKHGVLTNPVAR